MGLPFKHVHVLQDRPPRTLSQPQPHRPPPQPHPPASKPRQLPAARDQPGPEPQPRPDPSPEFGFKPEHGPACKPEPDSEPTSQPEVEAPAGQPSMPGKNSVHSSSLLEASEGRESGPRLGQQGQQHPWKPGEQVLPLPLGAEHRGAEMHQPQPMEWQVMHCC